jgi:hypothetical protein
LIGSPNAIVGGSSGAGKHRFQRLKCLVSGLKKPGSTIEKLTTQIPGAEKSTKPDRPRKYCSAKERQAEYRREKKTKQA